LCGIATMLTNRNAVSALPQFLSRGTKDPQVNGAGRQEGNRAGRCLCN
jgi:hypothetical protein